MWSDFKWTSQQLKHINHIRKTETSRYCLLDLKEQCDQAVLFTFIDRDCFNFHFYFDDSLWEPFVVIFLSVELITFGKSLKIPCDTSQIWTQVLKLYIDESVTNDKTCFDPSSREWIKLNSSVFSILLRKNEVSRYL